MSLELYSVLPIKIRWHKVLLPAASGFEKNEITLSSSYHKITY